MRAETPGTFHPIGDSTRELKDDSERDFDEAAVSPPSAIPSHDARQIAQQTIDDSAILSMPSVRGERQELPGPRPVFVKGSAVPTALPS